MSRTSHGNEAGVVFSFVEVDHIYVTRNASSRAWLKSASAPARKEACTPIRSRWIYAFYFGAGPRPRLFAEFAADEAGRLRGLPGDKRMKLEPAVCPDGASLDGPLASLPNTINARPVYWFFVVSRIRLACASLRELCRFEMAQPEFDGFVFARRGDTHLLVVDLGKKSTFVEAADGRFPALPVIDFLSLAYKLHADFERGVDHYLKYITALPGSSEREQRAVVHRALKYTLACTLDRMIDQRPKLANKVKGYGNIEITTYIKDYQDEIAIRKMARQGRAQGLCALLRSTHLELVESWYREREEESYPEFLEHLARLQHRLEESPEGIAYLQDPAPVNMHALRKYIFPEYAFSNSPEAKKYVSASKKAINAVTNLWGKFLPWYFVPKATKKASADALHDQQETVRRMNELLGDEVLSLKPPKEGHKGYCRYEVKKLIKTVDMPEEMARAEGEMAAAEKRVSAAEKALKDAEKANKGSVRIKGDKGRAVWAHVPLNLQLAVDTLNNLWKIAALIEKAPDERGFFDMMDGLNGANSLLKGIVWEKMKDEGVGWGKAVGIRAVRYASALGAILDALAAVKEISEAMQEDDRASAVASGVAGLAAVGTGIMGFFAIVNPPLALALAALQGGAAVAAFLLRDDRFENFVEHCTFGESYGTSSAHPKWADGSYDTWADPELGLQRQIATLYALITTFKVMMYNRSAVLVTLGYYDEDMELVVRYYDDFTRPKKPIEVVVNLSTGNWTANLNSNAPRRMQVEEAPGGNRIVALRIHFDLDWSPRGITTSFCTVVIRRGVVIGSGLLKARIPHTPTRLNDDEREAYGTRADSESPDEGLVYPLFGPHGENSREKESI